MACRPFETFGEVQKELAELMEAGALEFDAAVNAAT